MPISCRTSRSSRAGVKTNTVSNTAFRGFGGPQGMMAIERVIDAIAWSLGRDPLDVRKANLYGAGRDLTPYGHDGRGLRCRAGSDRAAGAHVRLSRAGGRRSRRSTPRSPILKRGIALTPVKFGISFTLTHLNQAGALVHVYQDGSVHLNHGGTEMGQGLLHQGRPGGGRGIRHRARARAHHRDLDRQGAEHVGDRGLFRHRPQRHGGAAGRRAQIKRGSARFASETWNVAEDLISFRDDRVFIGNESVPFGELAQKAYGARVHLSATGFYKTPKMSLGSRQGQRAGRSSISLTARPAREVAIDTLTGEMTVRRVDILHDVGRSINPAIDIGQIEGGFVQGMGWLTTEELVYDDKGRLLTHAPSTYKIPVASDVPADFRVALFDGANREDTIYRSKAVGEPPLMLGISVFAAIADAIHAARPGQPVALDAPATPEAVLKALGPVDAVAVLAPLVTS